MRAPLLAKVDAAPPDMIEALSSVCYAAPRMGSDLPELTIIRQQLVKKFGSEYAAEAADDATRDKW